MEKRADGVSYRQRVELVLAALLPATLGLLRPLCSAGRMSWLGPILALPVGMWLGWLWRKLGKRGLPWDLERAFGVGLGKLAQVLYLLWALTLLCGGAQSFSHRLGRLLPGMEWFFLFSAAVICLWLSRGKEESLVRTGRLFFLATAVTLAFALVLAAPGLDWRNLWPPEKGDVVGVPYSALLCLSLAGYGVFALCLPHRGEEQGGFGKTMLGMVALVWLLLTVVGTFGPKLASEIEEPFLMVLQGVAVPGAFRRGEAALAAALTLADFALLSLLGRGCRSLWERAMPARWSWGGYVLPGLAILAAGALEKSGMWQMVAKWIPAGNLLFGVALPALTVFGEKVRRTEKEQSIFSAPKMVQKADIGGDFTDKKSQKENQKKC